MTKEESKVYQQDKNDDQDDVEQEILLNTQNKKFKTRPKFL